MTIECKQFLNKIIKKTTTAFLWGDGTVMPRNGSVFFVDTGQKLLAITAKHVYEGYLRTPEAQRVICKIGNLDFNPTERLVSPTAHDIDIVTFRITDDELKMLQKQVVPWPPVCPTQHSAALICGIPSAGKSIPNPGIAQFTLYSGMVEVQNVSEYSLSMIIPPNEELVDITGLGFPPRNLDMGGMSGGPVVLLQATEEGLVTWSLVGVIEEGHQQFEIIRATRADFINDDGSIGERYPA